MLRALVLALTILANSPSHASAETQTRTLDVLPPNHLKMADDSSGAQLTFLTQEIGSSALYFHQQSFLRDGSMVLYLEQGRGLAGYVFATGERVVFGIPSGGSTVATASTHRNSFFTYWGGKVYEITPHVEISSNPEHEPSAATADIRYIADLAVSAEITENSTGELLAGYSGGSIWTVNVATGAKRRAYTVPDSIGWHGHLQWSRTDSGLLSFAGSPNRLQVVNVRTGERFVPYYEIPNELVTHESWWINDEILFCGSPREHGQDQSHVKSLNIRTGTVRIVGNGSWWPGATPSELAHFNWWHSSASYDGKWVVGDNWHGELMLFEGATTRSRLLTVGHRTYGGGSHPEPGFNQDGTKIVFGSDRFGKNRELPCVVDIPDAWQREAQAPLPDPRYVGE